jgi:hypothetical protein
MTDRRREEEERRKRKQEEERRKARERSIQHQRQELLHRNRYRDYYDRNRRRRKRDCSMGMPFITAFMGDPAMPFYCNDVRDVNGNTTYELIKQEGPFVRLKRYMKHHVVSIAKKILIHNAPERSDCPVCGVGTLKKFPDGIIRCSWCGYRPDKQFLKRS